MKLYDKMAQTHFGFDRKNKSQSFRIEVELTSPIDDEKLLDALKKTLKLFPTVACRPIVPLNRTRIGMEPNPVEPVIYHDDAPYALGSDETNGYLFRLITNGSKITLSMYHAVTDGHGAVSFMTHLLWFYLSALGHEIDPQGMILSPEDLNDKDLTDSLEERLAQRGITGEQDDPHVPPQEMVFHDTREDELYDADVFSFTRYRIPFAQLKALVRRLGTTPMLLFSVLTAQAMSETCDVGDKIIHCCYAADIRGKLNSRSCDEFSAMGHLYFLPEMLDTTLEDQLKSVKGLLDETISGDLILHLIKRFMDVYDCIADYMDYTYHDFAVEQMSEKTKLSSASFFISNTGLVRLPKDMTPFVKSYHATAVPAKYDPTIVFYTFGDTFYISFSHNSTDNILLERTLEKLAAMGVESEIDHPMTTMKIDYLGKLKFEQ